MKPTSAIIGPVDYTIEWVHGLLDVDDGLEMFGVSRSMRQQIQINDALTKRGKKATLFHEITHMVVEGSGLELESEAEESLVRVMESMLYDTLTRIENRDLTRYLFGDACA